MSPGPIAWVTGLPASGKSTFAVRLRDRLRAAGRAALVLDGDAVRAALAPPPGYDEAGRAAFYETLGNLALTLAREDPALAVIVAATGHRRAFRDRVRAPAARFVEILVDTPAELCAARDPKGLWARAAAGGLALPGAGVAFERPLAPEVVASGGEDARAVEAAAALLLLS